MCRGQEVGGQATPHFTPETFQRQVPGLRVAGRFLSQSDTGTHVSASLELPFSFSSIAVQSRARECAQAVGGARGHPRRASARTTAHWVFHLKPLYSVELT